MRYIFPLRKNEKFSYFKKNLSTTTVSFIFVVDQMKKIFGNTDNEEYVIKEAEGVVHVANSKYTQELFFVAPFYHREIPEEMEKLVMTSIMLSPV